MDESENMRSQTNAAWNVFSQVAEGLNTYHIHSQAVDVEEVKDPPVYAVFSVSMTGLNEEQIKDFKIIFQYSVLKSDIYIITFPFFIHLYVLLKSFISWPFFVLILYISIWIIVSIINMHRVKEYKKYNITYLALNTMLNTFVYIK